MSDAVAKKQWGAIIQSMRAKLPIRFGCSFSFFSGMARAVDVGANFTVFDIFMDPPEVADRKALASDWQTVGRDLIAARNSIIGPIHPTK